MRAAGPDMNVMSKSNLPRALALSTALLGTLSAAEQQEKSFSTQLSRPLACRYLLSLPAGYDSDSAQTWPLIIFLHGAGERGDDLERLKKHGPPKLIAQGRDLGAIVASPQTPEGEVWDPQLVKALTDELAATLRVDQSRIYLTGLSMGGFGAWETALLYPDTYAAIVPICGGAGVRFLLAERIRSLPVWIFHGAKDTVVEPAHSQRMHEALKHIGGNVRFTLYPDAAHDSWTSAYDDPELWSWLLAQKRPD